MGRKYFVVAAVMLVAVLAFGPTEAFAQKITLVNCAPSMTASLGVSSTGDRNAERTGPGADTAVAYELPVSGPWNARADAGTVAWRFQERDALTDVLLRQERVRLSRITVSAVRRPDRRDCGAAIRPFAVVGIGVYRYRFPDQHVGVATGGIHALFGMDIVPGDRYGFTWEAGIRAINGPRRGPVFSYTLFTVQAAVGARIKF